MKTFQKYYQTSSQSFIEQALSCPDNVITLKRDGGFCYINAGQLHRHDGTIIPVPYVLPVLSPEKYILCELVYPNPKSINQNRTKYGLYPDSKSRFANSILLSKPERAELLQEKVPAELYCFDLVSDAADPYIERRKALAAVLEPRLSDNPVLATKYQYISMANAFSNKDYNTAEMVAQWLADGQEGAVVQNINAPYAWSNSDTPKRPRTTLKIKQHATYDVRVEEEIFYHEPNGEIKYGLVNADHIKEAPYGERGEMRPDCRIFQDGDIPVNRFFAFNLFSSLVVAAAVESVDGTIPNLDSPTNTFLPIGRVSSGFTDSDRMKDFRGKVIEIGAMSYDNKAYSFRHPVFKQER